MLSVYKSNIKCGIDRRALLRAGHTNQMNVKVRASLRCENYPSFVSVFFMPAYCETELIRSSMIKIPAMHSRKDIPIFSL